jgi:hypothetical protein
MKCPKCKQTLIDGGERKYETLMEHVEDPNKMDYPLRPSYVCPNQCFGEDSFFDCEGAFYSGISLKVLPSNCFSALDSSDREIGIKVYLIGLSDNFRHYASGLKAFMIKGEKDIPSQWTWIFYALKGKCVKIYYRWKYRKDK